MELKETDLPGIGKKYSIKTSNGQALVIVIYNTGKREIYLTDDEDVICSFDLTDDEARELGFLIAGALYQPIKTEKMELILKEVVMEWVKVESESSFIDKTIAELQIRKLTGASVIAIVRGKDIIPSPDPYKEKILLGDTLVVVGTRQQINNLLSICGGCST